jgi:membrane protein DedA with SNARE-associated domain
MTPTNLAAGLVSLPAWEFTLAVSLAAPLRAGVYSLLGTSILSWGPLVSLAVGVGLVALVLLPLSIPAVRSWVLVTEAKSTERADGEGSG